MLAQRALADRLFLGRNYFEEAMSEGRNNQEECAGEDGMERPGVRSGVPDMETVMATYEAALLRYATRLLNNADAAQDVVQTAFIRLHEHWEECSAWAADHTKNWLYRTTHNAAVDYIRREERLKKLHGSHAEETGETVDAVQSRGLEDDDRKKLVLAFIAKLDDAEREVLLLRLQEGLSYQEIAAVTGRTQGNVGCLLHFGVKNLSERLKKAGAI